MKVDFEKLYGDSFPGESDVLSFVSCVETNFVDPEKTNAKIALHQAARMVWFADQLEPIAPGRHAIQIHFYVIAAESVAKLTVGFTGKGQSKKHVKLFFETICDGEARKRLSNAFERTLRPDGTPDGSLLTWEETVDFLYEVRCDVAHEGEFWSAELQPGWNIPSDLGYLKVCITLHEIRRMILRGALRACKTMLPPDVKCP